MTDIHQVLTTSKIKIGIIGSSILLSKIKKALKKFPSFEPVFFNCESDDNAHDIAQQIEHQVEVVFFTEYYTYLKAMEHTKLSIPVHAVPLLGSGMYRSLYKIYAQNQATAASIDSFTQAYILEILTELDMSFDPLFFYEGQLADPELDVLQFHMQHYAKNQSLVVLTGIQSVAKRLTHLNIPHEWVIPTHQDMVVALERALLSTTTRRNKEAQIVVGLIEIDHYEQLVYQSPTEHDLQALRLDIHRTLLDYVKLLDGYLLPVGADEYLFFTTRGIFERETKGYKFMPILDHVQRNYGYSLSTGIGFGRSSADAANHARLALRHCKDEGGNACYIVREDKAVIGPVEMKEPMLYELSVTDRHTLEKAKKAGMSATYLNRMMARIKRTGVMKYTAQELAHVLQLSVRSTHRLLLKWLDAGLVEISGQEKHASRGRPRHIYHMNFFD